MKMFSVTEVLSPWSNFNSVPADVLNKAADRGKRLHAAAAAKLSGTFLVSPLLPEDAGYWESLSAWIDDYVSHVYDVEPELRDEKMGYYGHPDLICKVGNYFTVCDWKTPTVEALTWRPQLSAYVHLAAINYKQYSVNWRGMAVQPDPDGKQAKAILYQNSERDFAVFLSALNCYRYFKS